jgi:hypothetical protein
MAIARPMASVSKSYFVKIGRAEDLPASDVIAW